MDTAISPERMTAYKRGARERLVREELAMCKRRETAWDVARHAAALLRTEFGARRVRVFGSLAAGVRFSITSDLDLAVEGIAPDRFWRAWAALDAIASPFELDLIALEFAPQKLIKAIEGEGVEV